MKSAFVKYALCIFFLSAILDSVYPSKAYAAYPISHHHYQEGLTEIPPQKSNKLRRIDTAPKADSQKEPKKQRSGIFGLLSFFCSILLLLHPETFIIASILALTFGFIGIQKYRRPKFLAIIGLLITIFSLMMVFLL